MKVLITGANRGLGKCVVTQLSPYVRKLYVASRDPELMQKDFQADGINFYQAIPFDLAESDFEKIWEPFADLSMMDAVIHTASPYIPKKLSLVSDDEMDFIARCVTNEVKFLTKISKHLNPYNARLILTSSIISLPGNRTRGIMSWAKSSLDAIAEILHHELPKGVKIFNFNLGTFRDDKGLVESGDAISTDLIAEKIKNAAIGIFNIPGYELCLKAPNDDTLIESLKSV